MNMNYKKMLKYIIIALFIFAQKPNYVSAETITCVYEMPAINYSYKDELQPHDQKNDTSIERITVKVSGKKKYSITVNSHLNKSWNNTSFKDDDLARDHIWKNKKCPSYVYRTSSGNLQIIDESKFDKYMDEFYTYSGKKHPLALATQNGKEMEPMNHLVTKASKKWIDIINKYADKDGKLPTEVNNLKNNFIKSVEKSSAYKNKLSSNSKLNDLINIEKKQEEIEDKEKELNNATSDYCSLYCSETHCKNQTNSSAKTQCVSSCDSTYKPKCDEAYDSCKNIQSSTDKTKCIQNALTSSGLDASYTSDRTSAVTKLQSEIRELRTIVSNAKVSGLKITIGEGYKVKCDDVSMFHDLWVMLIIAAPALVLVLGTFDFLKAIIAGDEQKMKKAWKNFPKRLLALVLLILIPQLISIIVNISTDDTASDSSLMYCIINGGSK